MAESEYYQLSIHGAILTLPDGTTVELPACRLADLDAVVTETIHVNYDPVN